MIEGRRWRGSPGAACRVRPASFPDHSSLRVRALLYLLLPFLLIARVESARGYSISGA